MKILHKQGGSVYFGDDLRVYKNIIVVVGAYLFFVGMLFGQEITFDNTHDVNIPDYATLRIGPFYSTVAFTQQFGYRWTGSSGIGTDYLYNNRRGEIGKDGSDFPLISTLSFRNYLLITRNMDLDISFWMSYEYYPLDTQDGSFYIDMPEEGVLGTITLNYRITPVLTGTIYERFRYRIDYFDTRGNIDRYGGMRYKHIDNTFGTHLNWNFARDKKFRFDVSRQDIISFSDGFDDQERTTYTEMLEYSQRVIVNISVGGNYSFNQTTYKVDYRPDNSYQSFYLFAKYNDGVGDDNGVHIKMSDYTTASIGVGYSAGVNGDVRVGDTIREVNGVVSTNNISGIYSVDGNNFAQFIWFANIKTLLREDVWHSLGYSSSINTGYRTAFELVDSLEYRLEWHGEATTATLLSEYRTTVPSGNIFSDYADWITRLDVTYPLTRYIDLHGMLRYQVRENQPNLLPNEIYDPETTSNYNIWTGRIGSSFSVTKTIKFHTYYTHVSRDSDNDDLVYTRDIFEAYFRYTHQF